MDEREDSDGQESGASLTAQAAGATILRPFVQFAGGSTRPSAPSVVSFDRRELGQILQVYGRGVSEGEWRDYAIDFLDTKAVFSVFKRTSEVPLYTIEKDPKLARRQGAYCVAGSAGQVLRRGHDLPRVLSFFDRKLKLVRG